MVYSEPRPYMKYDEITPIDKCNKAYGKPSGYFIYICIVFIFNQRTFYVNNSFIWNFIIFNNNSFGKSCE